jgi:serine/threonine-protein kinase
VHRDVSPSNVFLTFEGDVKLLDFGIAKSVGAISSTRDGVVKGKLGYASPEQCLGEPVDKRSDLFAVGVMLWEAIAKRKRALGGTEASMFQSRVEGTEQRIEDACPDVPEVLVAMCERALARNPTERYASAQEFRLAIEDYLRSTKFEGGREQLQQLLRTHFETEMLDLRRRIDEHLGEARSRSSRPPRPGELPSELMQEVPRPSRLPDLASVRTQANSSGRDELAPAARRPSKHGRIALFVLCAVALGLAAVAAIRLNSNEPLPATRLAPQAALPAAAKANDTNESSPQRAQISVALEVAPAKVELRLDGRLIANPYRATHSRDELLHHLSARLTGYETVELELRYDHDVELSLALEKSKTLVAPLIRGATPGGRTKGGLGSSLPGTVGRASDVVQPGEDLRGQAPRSRTRDLDETDPYKR